jgi:hypothetical protein
MKRLHDIALTLVLSLVLGGLAGCGSGTVAPTAISASAALKGNWLVTGVLPISGPVFPLPTQFGLALTLDVVNGQVLADSTNFYPCTNGAVGGSGSMAPAAIAADGTFTLQTLQIAGFTPTVVMTIHGTLPKTLGASWSGTYSATNSNTGCVPVSGTFIAEPIQPVTGTFSGTGSLGSPNSHIVTAPILTITLQQGGPASLDPPLGNSLVNSASALSGTISVAGFPCFTTGTANIPSGSVIGDLVDAQFTMNDGSRLLLIGSIPDPSVASIRLTSLLVNGGGCNGWFGSSGTILTKQ